MPFYFCFIYLFIFFCHSFCRKDQFTVLILKFGQYWRCYWSRSTKDPADPHYFVIVVLPSQVSVKYWTARGRNFIAQSWVLSIPPGCLRCLYEIDGKFIPPPLQTRMGKWCILAFHGFIHDLWGGGGVGFAVSFFMILSKIVAPWGLPIIWWSFGLK